MGVAARRKVVGVNSRWTARIILIFILIGFFLLMADLQRRLMRMQQMRKPAATSTH